MVSNWKTSNITDLLRPNGIKIGPFGSQLKKELFIQNGDYKVYGQENVYAQNFKIGDRYMTRSHFDKLRACELLPGDFVMSTMGTVGKCAIVPTHITRGIMDSHLIRLRFDEKVIDNTYLLQLFSPDIRFLKDQTDKLSVGGIMDGLSVKIVSSLKVEYPLSVEEQKAIVNVLSAADGMISSLEKLIAKRKAIKQGVMQELLTGKKRLPEFVGEWNTINLSKKSKIKARIGWQGLTTNEYLDAGFAYLVTGTDFANGKIDWNGCHYVAKDRFDQDKNIQIQNDDVLITKDGSLGKTALVKGLNKPATLNSGVFVIRPIQGAYDPAFVYYILSSFVFKDFLDHLSAGSTIIHLYQKDINKFEFAAPPTIEEQTAIASVLSDMDNEIEALEQKLAKARQVKQGMMQQLLTGKMRLV